SAGGFPITEISPAGGCAIINPIVALTPEHGISTVQCGPCTIDFDHYLWGAGTAGAWDTTVYINGCDVPCYYSYTDYDVNGPPNNDGSFQSSVPPLGQFVVRNNTVVPTMKYLFRDIFSAAHWMQGTYPTIRNAIAMLSLCRDLPDNPFFLPNTDWTGAIQYTGLTSA